MSFYERLLFEDLRAAPRTWLVTGVAGFIGSHLLEALLLLGQRVVGVDNFTTGSPRNLEYVREAVSADAWSRFDCREGTITDMGVCREATRDVDFVLHQAAFVSVPLSRQDPVACHDVNVTGTLNLLIASRDHKVSRVVYASSCKVYGDDPHLPKVEAHCGVPQSPYGVSKAVNELYANLFHEQYQLECTGLRAFNVFGPRQNPYGGYAAVVPKWIHAMLNDQPCQILGDGSATRDFVPVQDVVQAHLLAALAPAAAVSGKVYNVGLGRRTSLVELHAQLASIVVENLRDLSVLPPVSAPPRIGTVEHSWADLSLAEADLRYHPLVGLEEGLAEAVRWYARESRPA